MDKSLKIKIPVPSCLNVISDMTSSGYKINGKQRTILSNVQRRNIQTVAPQLPSEMSIYQMAAQGEIILLDDKLNEQKVDVDMPDNNGFSPLMWACANNQKQTVELLVYKGSNYNLCADNGENALLLAANYGHKDIVLYLLKLGMDIDQSDELENTSLILSSFNNHCECCKLLLEWGADITARNSDGMCAYDVAVKRGNTATVTVLKQYITELLNSS